MSGETDSCDETGNPAEHHNSAAFRGCAMRGILWGVELAIQKNLTKSMIYSVYWWSRGDDTDPDDSST
jgi:hypothetical protein